MVKHLSNTHPATTGPADSKRRITLDAEFDEALARLTTARLGWEDAHNRHCSFASRLDALDRLQQRRIEMSALLTGLGIEV